MFRFQEHMRQKQRERRAEEAAKRREEEAVESKPLIDTTADIRRFDEPRWKLVLEVFIKHFLKMAGKSAEYKNNGQSYMYLRSAENLITLLEDMSFPTTEWRAQVVNI